MSKLLSVAAVLRRFRVHHLTMILVGICCIAPWLPPMDLGSEAANWDFGARIFVSTSWLLIACLMVARPPFSGEMPEFERLDV